jgi:hypothetical protein
LHTFALNVTIILIEVTGIMAIIIAKLYLAYLWAKEQDVLGRNNRLLSFDMRRTT